MRHVKKCQWTSLVVQWLRLHASNAGHKNLIPGRRMKIPLAVWQKIKKKKKISYWRYRNKVFPITKYVLLPKRIQHTTDDQSVSPPCNAVVRDTVSSPKISLINRGLGQAQQYVKHFMQRHIYIRSAGVALLLTFNQNTISFL